MNLSVPALLGTELFLLLAFLALAWGVLSWRTRRQRTRSLEEMADLLERNTAERGLHYSQWLKSHQPLSDEAAQEVAAQWLEAEKQFWQVFVAWHLHPDPKTLADFPHRLQRLLNSRLESLARALPSKDEASASQPAAAAPASVPDPEPEAPAPSEPSPAPEMEEEPVTDEPETDQEEDGVLIYSDQTASSTSPPESETGEAESGTDDEIRVVTDDEKEASAPQIPSS